MLRLFELSPSPNNLKVVTALRYKGVPFESVPVDPFDRAPVIAASGQELTPVIEDRGIVLTDSEAILQYLDAHHPGAPRLYPSDRAGRYRCDEWRKRLDREIVRHWLPVFLFAIKRREDLDANALAAFHGSLANFEQELGDGDSFAAAPDEAVCDLRMAVWLAYAMPGEPLCERVGLFRRFREIYAVEPGRFPGLERFMQRWHPKM